MKVIMPYVTWRAAGESNRKKKLGGMHGFKLRKWEDCLLPK